jgi:preprotein translocase subunit SecA
MYHKLAGMTGTAVTEEAEFYEIYKLEVVEIPTNKPVRRKDLDDLIYRTKREKYNATIDKIKEYHERGQPVLVGTTSVEVSETISRMLQRAGIKHNVLNAKQHQRESEIVAEAGRKGAVTIATNMAGRGTDIKLGEGVAELGGLAIIGTERHESRRIDLQLRGRAGRQGDPGETQFFVSMEDNLMRYFASDRVVNMMDRLKFKEGEVIQHPWFTKALERAQKRVEQNNFGIRKRQLEYDDVLNNQRKVIYGRRNHALHGERLTDDIYEMLFDLIAEMVETHHKAGDMSGLREELLRTLAIDVPVDTSEFTALSEHELIERLVEEARKGYRAKEKMLSQPFLKALKQLDQSLDAKQKPNNIQIIFTDGVRRMRVVVNFRKAIESEGRELFRALERAAVLSVIDDKWMEHLRELDSLKEGIGLRAFGQKDPLLEYKREAFLMFKNLLLEINREVIALVWKAVPETAADDPRMRQEAEVRRRSNVDLARAKARHEAAPTLSERVAGERREAAPAAPREKQMPVVVGPKIGRNDPCPCGSGKKFKHCHGKNA